MGDWGIKISEEGEDVKTATDKQLILSSGLNALKIAKVGILSSTEVAHGLPYIPAFISSQSLIGGNSKMGLVGYYFYTMAYTDSIHFHPSGGGNTKYYIFYQDGTS